MATAAGTKWVYNAADPKVTPEARSLFMKYSNIPEEDIIPHIKAVVRLPPNVPISLHPL